MMSNPLPLPSREQVERGVAVVTAEDNRWHRCDLKTTSLLGNVLMRQLAADARRRRDGDVPRRLLTEASASNVLIVRDGTIVAPPKDNLILPGITYDATLEFAREAGVPLDVRAGHARRGAGRRRDVAVVVDQGSARRHDGRRPAVRRRRARAGVPARLDAFQQRKRAKRYAAARSRTRRGRRTRVVRPVSSSGASCRSGRGGTRGPGRGARSTVTTSPMNSDVVAGAVPRVVPAFEPRDAAVDQRRIGPAEPERHAGEAVGVRAREAPRELDLAPPTAR